MVNLINEIVPLTHHHAQLPNMKVFKKISLALILFLLIYAFYVVKSTGFFRSIENTFAGEIVKKVALPGAEDIFVSPLDSFALISSTTRAIFPPSEEEKGGLFLIDLNDQNYTPIPLTNSFNQPFAPHGISVLKKDSSHLVMAINHTPSGHSIEVFELIDRKLKHLKTLTDASMISPNDLVIIDEHRFYFTNDHGYTEGFGAFVEEYVGIGFGNVVYFDGTNYQTVDNRIAYANGINYDPKRALLFVASPRGFLVKVYTKKPDGTLDFIEDIPCGTGVDNIEFDEKGQLWIGCHPNLLRFSAYAKGKQKTSPSEIITIDYQSKGQYSVEQIYLEDGENMSAASVASPFGNLIFAGNVMDDQFLILKRSN